MIYHKLKTVDSLCDEDIPYLSLLAQLVSDRP